MKLNNLLGSLIRPCQCVCGPKFIIKQWGNIVLSSQATHEVRNALWPNCTFLALKSILRTWQYWLNCTCCTSLTSYSTKILTYLYVASACILPSVKIWSMVITALGCGRTFLSHACVCVSGYTVKKVKLNNLLGSLIRPWQCVCGPKLIIKQWGNIVFIISHYAFWEREVRNALWPNWTFLALKSILRTWQYWLNGTCCTALTSYSTIIITYSCVASACISTFREDLESGNYCIRLWSALSCRTPVCVWAVTQ